MSARKRGNPKKMKQARELSEARAASVVEALAATGVHRDRMTAQGFGGERPLPEGLNSKRVEVMVMGLPENEITAPIVAASSPASLAI